MFALITKCVLPELSECTPQVIAWSFQDQKWGIWLSCKAKSQQPISPQRSSAANRQSGITMNRGWSSTKAAKIRSIYITSSGKKISTICVKAYSGDGQNKCTPGIGHDSIDS